MANAASWAPHTYHDRPCRPRVNQHPSEKGTIRFQETEHGRDGRHHAWRCTAFLLRLVQGSDRCYIAFDDDNTARLKSLHALCQRSSCHPTRRTRSGNACLDFRVLLRRQVVRTVKTIPRVLWPFCTAEDPAPTITPPPRLPWETLGGKRVRALPATWCCAAAHWAVATMDSCPP